MQFAAYIVATIAVTCTNLKPPLSQRQEARDDKVVGRTEIACCNNLLIYDRIIGVGAALSCRSVQQFRGYVLAYVAGNGAAAHCSCELSFSVSDISRTVFATHPARATRTATRANERRTDGRINCNASV